MSDYEKYTICVQVLVELIESYGEDIRDCIRCDNWINNVRADMEKVDALDKALDIVLAESLYME